MNRNKQIKRYQCITPCLLSFAKQDMVSRYDVRPSMVLSTPQISSGGSNVPPYTKEKVEQSMFIKAKRKTINGQCMLHDTFALLKLYHTIL